MLRRAVLPLPVPAQLPRDVHGFVARDRELGRLDGVEVTTDGRTNPQWVARLAPWSAGEVYDPEEVAEWRWVPWAVFRTLAATAPWALSPWAVEQVRRLPEAP